MVGMISGFRAAVLGGPMPADIILMSLEHGRRMHAPLTAHL